MEPEDSLSGSPFNCFHNLPSGELVFKFLITGEKTVLLNKITVVKESLTKSLLSLEFFHGSTLPLASNPSSLAWPGRLSFSVLPYSMVTHFQTLYTLFFPGTLFTHPLSHHPDSTCPVPVLLISAVRPLPPGSLLHSCLHIWIRSPSRVSR